MSGWQLRPTAPPAAHLGGCQCAQGQCQGLLREHGRRGGHGGGQLRGAGLGGRRQQQRRLRLRAGRRQQRLQLASRQRLLQLPALLQLPPAQLQRAAVGVRLQFVLRGEEEKKEMAMPATYVPGFHEPGVVGRMKYR